LRVKQLHDVRDRERHIFAKPIEFRTNELIAAERKIHEFVEIKRET
jgi:hypothetical protein